MTQTAYPYRKVRSKRYHFISIGKKRIEKVVEFIALGENFVNLAFGDLLPNGSIDYKVNSNNGDIVKVLAPNSTLEYSGPTIRFSAWNL